MNKDNKRKAKLDALKSRLRNAENLKKHLNNISEKPIETPNDPEEEPSSFDLLLAKRQQSKEQSFIDAVSRIPEYKSGEYYHLDAVSNRYKTLTSKASKVAAGFSHQNKLKMAKKRMQQIVVGLIKDMRYR